MKEDEGLNNSEGMQGIKVEHNPHLLLPVSSTCALDIQEHSIKVTYKTDYYDY